MRELLSLPSSKVSSLQDSSASSTWYKYVLELDEGSLSALLNPKLSPRGKALLEQDMKP